MKSQAARRCNKKTDEQPDFSTKHARVSSSAIQGSDRQRRIEFKVLWLAVLSGSGLLLASLHSFKLIQMYLAVNEHPVTTDLPIEIETISPVAPIENPKTPDTAPPAFIADTEHLLSPFIEIDRKIYGLKQRKTVIGGEYPEFVTGGASLEMFQGLWVKNDDYTTSDNPTCPQLAYDQDKFSCNYEQSVHRRTHKKYVAPNLEPFNATFFLEKIKEQGPILFVGDSLSGQMRASLICLLESQLGWTLNEEEKIFINSTDISNFATSAIPMDKELMEHVEVIPAHPNDEEEFERYTNLTWADEAIAMNASYVIFNTGAWWNNELHFRWRGPWCEYESWRQVSGLEMVDIFEKAFRKTVIPILRRLRDHGITTVWRDSGSAGELGTWTGKMKSIPNLRYYVLLPVFNNIGRKLVTELAGGLIAPIFDMSQDRWDDHVRDDAKYADSDPMHWCMNHNEYDVPAVWTQLLTQVLFGNGNDKVAASEDKSELKTMTQSSTTEILSEQPVAKQNNEQSRRMLRADQVYVPYSRSNQTDCPCNHGKTFYHCVANINCQWVEYTKKERARRDRKKKMMRLMQYLGFATAEQGEEGSETHQCTEKERR